jgi:peptidoglycan/xylan/chitin deacetylase (PgdA/CDA1 family)
MPLDESYLAYPHRAYGMDQGRYAWRPPGARPRLHWPGGRAVAALLVVPIEHHGLTPPGKPFKHSGAMVTPYPDLRHYTSRDYGNRVGVYRILDALKARGLRATFPVNALQLERLRPLVDAIAAEGHEIAAYGLSTEHIHWGGLDPAMEADWVAQTRECFERAGFAPRTWLSPARSQSFSTPDLIAAAGFDICLDWEHDSIPSPMHTTAGTLTALPLSNELDDRTLLIERRQSEDEWASQILESFACCAAEFARHGGQMIGLALTPYVSGQPFRISSLRRLLDGIAGDDGVWAATASAIAVAAAPFVHRADAGP